LSVRLQSDCRRGGFALAAETGMIKDVHINNPKRLFAGGSNFVPTWLIGVELPRLPIFWRRLRLEKFGRLRSRARLAIASLIVHYLGWQARNRLLGSLAGVDDHSLK
jgi:hypothetical protein